MNMIIDGYTMFEANEEKLSFVRNDDRGYLEFTKNTLGGWDWKSWIEIPDNDYESTEVQITTGSQTAEFKGQMDAFCAQLETRKTKNQILIENLHSLGFEAVGCHYEREVDDAIVYVNGDRIDIRNWSVDAWELCRLAEGLE